MKISRIFFFNFLKKFVKFFCNILFVKKINFEMFFQNEFFSVNFFRKKIFLATLFRKFFFMKKYVFGNFWFWIFFFKTNNFSVLLFFEKNVSSKICFRRKRLETHIDNFSLKKKSKMNLFGFFVPFDVLVHYYRSLKKQEKPEIIKHEKFHPFPAFG